MAIRIDGKARAAQIRENIKNEVVSFKERFGYLPGLAVILVGDDPASQVYVRNKEKACIECGFYSEVCRMPGDTTQKQLNEKILEYNARKDIHGLLVQFPLPKHLSQKEVLDLIAPEKDVDGLTVQNAGKLLAGESGLVSCTPKGIIDLIKTTGTEISGKNAVVIGRSNLVGKPVSLLLLNENATVTVCHSKTKNLKEICKCADILVSAVGVPGLIDSDYIKPGAIVIDVGTSRVDGKLKGDVVFEDAEKVAGFITPVPGGVGPMTITMLLENTLETAIDQANK